MCHDNYETSFKVFKFINQFFPKYDFSTFKHKNLLYENIYSLNIYKNQLLVHVVR